MVGEEGLERPEGAVEGPGESIVHNEDLKKNLMNVFLDHPCRHKKVHTKISVY